jgi:hypothetical protein
MAAMTVKRPEQDGEKRPLKTLERVLSKAGLGSRVEARRWVHARRVKVNGTMIENGSTWNGMTSDLMTSRSSSGRVCTCCSTNRRGT